ncbi:MAG: hypothetical protein ACXACK_00905 [Candidatus Hodarchaeales archaeon]|jgi:uncharacterized membrane protein YbhN (UPF0104 family)
MVKVILRKTVDRGARIKQYFLRGHNNWFALVFSLLNFTLIFYNLLFINLFFIPEILKSYSIFFLVFGSLYFPLAAVLGWLDFKKGTYRAEIALTREISPIWQEVFKKLDSLDEKNHLLLSEIQRLEKK